MRPNHAGPAVRLHDVVAEYARRTPDAPAAMCGNETLTYLQLDLTANAMARRLAGEGVRPGRLAGLCAQRGLPSLVGLLAILKAGGAYVPLDPAYPAERLDFMVRDSAAPVVVTDRASRPSLPDLLDARVVHLEDDLPDDPAEVIDEPPGGATGDDLCYVIYTSGSVGRPKGSMNCHAGVMNTLRGLIDVLPVEDSFRVALVSSLNYDMSVFEVFGSWLIGGCVVVPRPEDAGDPDRLTAMVDTAAVNLWSSAPPLFGMVVQRALHAGRGLPESLRVVILGGDRFPPRLVADVGRVGPWVALYNLAGMTEVSYCSTWYRVTAADATRANIPWGLALRNQRMHVLGPDLRELPPGTEGELYIGGRGIGLGYWRRPSLTSQRFVPDPFASDPAARLYRTGDRVRVLTDGNLEFLGRLDHQIKLRGLRIEPGEIEATVDEHPGVRETVVVAAGDELCCYYISDRPPGSVGPPGPAELRAWIRRRLPEHMVPRQFVALPEFPLLPSGKIDRALLVARAETTRPAPPAPRRPADELEELIVRRFVELVGEGGIDDNFFDAGGNSLLATHYVTRLRDDLAIDLPLRALFNSRNLAEFAAAVREHGADQGRDIHVAAARLSTDKTRDADGTKAVRR